ncbi:ISNCY family transposase [Dongshaea marina]|uniref:ISNCY family transposase n=1 Tax=Dongshaea marina TaxID=2047966 RepID=UPI000D3EBDB0|nr:ISNCY family transposase [Dongshaea marina]
MSDRELNRLDVIRDVSERKMRQTDAAELLNLCVRQVRRLMNRFREHGPEGLINRNRGRPGNHRLSDSLRITALDIIRERYADFGPTLATEKLSEIHGIEVSKETIRQWMIADGLWKPYKQRSPRVYQPRYRRDCLGELIQIDGSDHDWFEGRSPKCCLLVFVDDATSKLMQIHFCDTESTFSYMNATRKYLQDHGKPVSFYSDKYSVFRVNKRDALHTEMMTQFGRALHDLNIDLICANSSQAKGRVERANRTLQDRLIKEMRLAGINTIEEANAWLPVFMADYNRRFAKPAKYSKDLHRPLREEPAELDDIFSWQEKRKLSKALTFQYDKVRYIVDPTPKTEALIGKNILIYDYPDGTIDAKYCGDSLPFKAFDKLDKVDQGAIVENKRLGSVLAFAQEEQERLETEGKRERSGHAPKRREQQRARKINPVIH